MTVDRRELHGANHFVQHAHSTEDGHRFHGIAGTHSTASRAADLTDGFMESGLC